jgi:biotin carboxyl carrier protein
VVDKSADRDARAALHQRCRDYVRLGAALGRGSLEHVRNYLSAVEEVRRIKADPDNLHHLGSPMAGMVAAVHAQSGQDVAEGDTLVVLEAMKMEMILASPLTGAVKEVYVKSGDGVDGGDLMVVFQ